MIVFERFFAIKSYGVAELSLYLITILSRKDTSLKVSNTQKIKI